MNCCVSSYKWFDHSEPQPPICKKDWNKSWHFNLGVNVYPWSGVRRVYEPPEIIRKKCVCMHFSEKRVENPKKVKKLWFHDDSLFMTLQIVRCPHHSAQHNTVSTSFKATSPCLPSHGQSEPCSLRAGSLSSPMLERLRAHPPAILWKPNGGASAHQHFSVLFNSIIS